MTPTADDMARTEAYLDVVGGPRLARMRRAQKKQTQELRDEAVIDHMTLMLARCVEEDIAAFGGE
jgi:hypothetical protein